MPKLTQGKLYSINHDMWFLKRPSFDDILILRDTTLLYLKNTNTELQFLFEHEHLFCHKCFYTSFEIIRI